MLSRYQRSRFPALSPPRSSRTSESDQGEDDPEFGAPAGSRPQVLHLIRSLNHSAYSSVTLTAQLRTPPDTSTPLNNDSARPRSPAARCVTVPLYRCKAGVCRRFESCRGAHPITPVIWGFLQGGSCPASDSSSGVVCVTSGPRDRVRPAATPARGGRALAVGGRTERSPTAGQADGTYANTRTPCVPVPVALTLRPGPGGLVDGVVLLLEQVDPGSASWSSSLD